LTALDVLAQPQKPKQPCSLAPNRLIQTVGASLHSYNAGRNCLASVSMLVARHSLSG
jgi:hypothetical protein